MIVSTQLRRREAVENHELPEDLHPLLRRVYANRGILNVQEQERSVKGLLSYQKLSGIERAVELLHQALSEHQRIVIVGDFDADGAPVPRCQCWRYIVWGLPTSSIWCQTVSKMATG